jgi:hypothetical protein
VTNPAYRAMSSMPPFSTEIADIKGQSFPLCPGVLLDVNLLCNSDGVVHLDAQIPHCALDFAMPQEQLDGPEIARAVDERCLGSTKRVP